MAQIDYAEPVGIAKEMEPMSDSVEEAIAGARSAQAFMKQRGIRRSWNNAIVVHSALKRGLAVDADDRGRVRLSDGQRERWYSNGYHPLNGRMAVRCARKKQVTNMLLRAYGVLAPDNAVFAPDDVQRAWDWAKGLTPVVLKPPDGMHGVDVYVGVTGQREFQLAFEQVARRGGQVLVEQFVAGVEHRVLVVDGRVFAAVRRVPAYVRGDGASEIARLIAVKSEARLSAGNPLHGEVKVDHLVERELERQGLSLMSRPASGREVRLRATSNTHFGGDAVDATDDLEPDEIQYVEEAASVFRGLRLAGFDVLLPRDGIGDKPCIVEINDNPAIALHHFPIKGTMRDAAGQVLDLMFP